MRDRWNPARPKRVKPVNNSRIVEGSGTGFVPLEGDTESSALDIVMSVPEEFSNSVPAAKLTLRKFRERVPTLNASNIILARMPVPLTPGSKDNILSEIF